MAGTLTRGYTFGASEEVTAAKLHALIDDGTISGITADDIASGTITDDKISSVGGNKFTGLANIPSGAGVIPKANLTSVAQKGANTDITSLSGLTTPLSTAQGGTGSTANANAANGVVVLDGSGKLPSSALTGLFGSWESKNNNTVYQATTDGFFVGNINASANISWGDIDGYTDSSNPPTTLRASASGWRVDSSFSGTSGNRKGSFCIPVKKGDYYKGVTTNGSGTPTVTYYWIPIGS